MILLPYAEIKEPFNAYFDLENNRSRIDYYGGVPCPTGSPMYMCSYLLFVGMVQTYQRGDQQPFGISYKVAPLTTETVFNDRTCFEVNGTHDGEVLAQAILPDLSEFTVHER